MHDQDFDRVRHRLGRTISESNRYEAIETIGRGGMGEVELCLDHRLGRSVARKFVPAELDSVAISERLQNEARVLARLEHPGIVPVYDAGVDQCGRPYYVMKFIEGQRFDEFVLATGSLFDRVSALVRIVEAVAYAHERGVLHRDLKPDNVIVGTLGAVSVLDWGLAKAMADFQWPGEDRPRASTKRSTSGMSRETGADRGSHIGLERTELGTVLGTPNWMSPEQARGLVADLDERTDVFGLGALLYFILTERAPGPPVGLDGRPPETQRSIDTKFGREARPLKAICAKAIDPAPEARFERAADLLHDLRSFLAHERVTAWREGRFDMGLRIARRHSGLLLLLAAYLIARAILLFLGNSG